jgi:hypothetical protein
MSNGQVFLIQESKKNNIGKSVLTKAEQNSVIGTDSHCDILAIPRQPTNELVSPDGFRF